MGPRLAALVVASVVGLTLPVWAADQSDAERTSRKALAFFEGHSEETIDAFLMRLRPAPLDEASRAKVIASLPQEGEIRPSRNDWKKLSAAQRILDYSAPPGPSRSRSSSSIPPSSGSTTAPWCWSRGRPWPCSVRMSLLRLSRTKWATTTTGMSIRRRCRHATTKRYESWS